MARGKRRTEAEESAFRSGPPRERTPLRDNLESIALAILLVLCVRQMVVEAFRIRHGSMAPTLLGEHREIRCPNCGWVFYVGGDKVGRDGEVECPNCRYHWRGASRFTSAGMPLEFRWPEFLWNSASTRDGETIEGTRAANRVQRGATRLFVNKFVYRLREPRRWEVAVFLYPLYGARCPVCDWEGTVESPDAICPDCGASELELEARNFIKRIAGLPGETVRLRNGDVYVDGAIARKPRHVQKELWFHVFDSSFRPRQELVTTWDFGREAGRWERYPEGGALTLDARGADFPVMAAFARQITDFYPYDGLSYELAPYRFHPAGRNSVGDCRIRARVRLLEADPSGGALVMAVEDAGHKFTYTVRTGKGGGASLEDDAGGVMENPALGLPAEQAQWLCLENYDDRVVAYLDGQEVFSHDYRARGEDTRGIEFGAKGARVMWERVVIERDIHYVNVPRGGGGEPVYVLGPDEYFVLGDNSPASSDSRRWPKPGIPADHLIGRAFFVFWPVHYMKWLTAGPGPGQG